MEPDPKSYGDHNDPRRHASPISSFLDQIPLGANRDSVMSDAYDMQDGQEHYYAYDRDSGREAMRVDPTTVSKSSNGVKRSAPMEETAYDDDITKRLRLRLDNASSAYETAGASMVDAATQTGTAETASAKIAKLWEEEVTAKAKHEAEMRMAQARYEAEIARRRQVIAELEYESKISALRELSELSTDKSTTSTPAVTRSAALGKPDPSRLQKSAGTSFVNASSTGDDRRQTADPIPRLQDTPRSTPAGKQQPAKPDATVAKQPKATQSASAPKEPPVGPSNVNGAIRRTAAPTTDRPAVKTSPPRARADSSRSHSGVIKTSRSPPPETRARPYPDTVRPYPDTARSYADTARTPTAGLKHLTCYFWKHTGCSKTAGECSYAHYDTGVTATDPERLRRFKNSGKGDWHTPR